MARRLFLEAAFLGTIALAGSTLGCGSDGGVAATPPIAPAPTIAPTETPRPSVARAFVHVMDHVPSSVDAPRHTYRVRTFRVDTPSGQLAATSAAPLVFAETQGAPALVVDPAGRFLYVSPSSFSKPAGGVDDGGPRTYRIEATTGALSATGQALQLEPEARALGATSTHLYVASSEPLGTHHWYMILRAFAVDARGRLTATNLRMRDYDSNPGFHGFLAVDADRDVFYTSRCWGAQIVAARLDPSRPEGFARLSASFSDETWEAECRESGSEQATNPPPPAGPGVDLPSTLSRSVYLPIAAGGFLISGGRSAEFVYPPGNLVARGQVDLSNIVTGWTFVKGRLAFSTDEWKQTASGPQHAGQGIVVVRVSTSGEMAVDFQLPIGSFERVDAMAFHPGGMLLYVIGQGVDPASRLELITYAVGADGSLAAVGSMPFAAGEDARVDAIVVTPAP